MVTFRVIYQVEGTENTEHYDFSFLENSKSSHKERYAWIRAMREALQYKHDAGIKLLALVRIA